MSNSEFHVWSFPDTNEVLLTDDPGPPVGGTFVGSYPRPDGFGWGKAGDAAKTKAKETGALIIYSAEFS